MREMSVDTDIDAVDRAIEGLAMGGSLRDVDRISVADGDPRTSAVAHLQPLGILRRGPCARPVHAASIANGPAASFLRTPVLGEEGPMRRVLRGILVVVVFSALSLAPMSASASGPLPVCSAVVIVLAPYLTWADIDPALTPALWELAADGALGSASVRTGALTPQPDGLFGAAVLSAGQPVAGPDAPEVGSLGAAVREAGGRTGAFGSSAVTVDDALLPGSAHATVVAGDPSGGVTFEETSPRAIRTDDAAPGGITTDLDVLEAAYRGALGRLGTDGAPLLVVIDAGDPSRARAHASDDHAWEVDRANAVATIDAVVAVALRSLPADAALIVVSTAQHAPRARAGFGPVLLYGAGPGAIYSPGTRRDGIVTLPDVSATALALLGLDTEPAMTGSPLSVRRDTLDRAERLGLVKKADASARALEAVRQPVWTGIISFAVAGLLLALLVVLRWRGAPRLVRRAIGYGLVLVCSVPAGSLLAQVAGYPGSAQGAWARLALGSGAVTALAVWRVGRGGPRAALGRVALLSALVILGDQLIGGDAAYGSAFSYSALFGTRFYGLGNEGAAVLVGSALTLTGIRMDRYGVSRMREFLWLGAVVVTVAVMPMLGANTGVAAWGTAAFATAYLYGQRRRIDWKVALLAVVAAAAIVAAAALMDTAVTGPSHLGRLLGAGGGLAPMLARKAALSLGILTATPLVVLLPLGVGALAYLLVRPKGPVGAVVSRERGAASALAGAVAATLLGLITEDSGVAVAALVMLVPASALATAALEQGDDDV
jgi:hypothetical protein